MSGERGYIAVLSAVLAPIIFGLCAFTVDCGNWYSEVQSVQRAADAAALAGVVYMPGDLTAAKSRALQIATDNGFTTGGRTSVVAEAVPGQPSRLKVTVSTVVDNTFGTILGLSTTTIKRTATASYQQPLQMGSPCNAFGNGPEPTTGAVNPRSTNCAAAGQFWANVGSPKAGKSYGDAYQDGNCTQTASGTDNCVAGLNTEYSNGGYYYSVTLTAPVSNLTIQAFDPAFVYVGDLCSVNFGSGSTAAVNAKNQYNYSPGTSVATASYRQDSTLYASGQASPYCTGDQLFSDVANQPPDTTYTVRQPVATSSLADPTSFPAITGCTQTFTGFSGDLYTALNQYQQNGTTVKYAGGVPVPAPTGASGYQDQIAKEFRQWVNLCTIPGTTPAGTYFVQVQTNASVDNQQGDGHNRFALRAFGSGGNDNQQIAISGLTNMAIYANLNNAHTSFYVTRVPPSAAGQVLQLRLFDIGDSSQPGAVAILPPTDSNYSAFSNCAATGPTQGPIAGCGITADSSYNGKWETVLVPIPADYTCDYASLTGCWVTLSYDYGAGQPSDTTSWQASLQGTPVHLVP